MNDATISPCGKYRYLLLRGGIGNPLVFVMLNPSTADEKIDDPTIRRCKKFAKDNGYTGIAVVNLYAYRATNPKELKAVDDPIGELNDHYLTGVCKNHDVCCAWGNNADKKRAIEVLGMIEGRARKILALDVAKTGMPKHPLYLRGDSKLRPYSLGGYGHKEENDDG